MSEKSMAWRTTLNVPIRLTVTWVVFSVYFGTDKRLHKRAESLVRKELKALREKKLGVRQLHDIKQQIVGHVSTIPGFWQQCG